MPEFVAGDLVSDRASKLVSLRDLTSSVNGPDYQSKRYERTVDLDFDHVKSYKDIMRDRALQNEEQRVKFIVEDKKRRNAESLVDEDSMAVPSISLPSTKEVARKRKKRWDVTPEEYMEAKKNETSTDIQRHTAPIINGILLTDSILDKILPPGYVKAPVPETYEPKDPDRAPDIVEKAQETYRMPSAIDARIDASKAMVEIPSEIPGVSGLDHFNQQDVKHFRKLIEVNPDSLSKDEKKEIEAMQLLLKVKNGTQITRKRAMRTITASARKFGPKMLLNQVLPILLEPNLDEQERHILVKLLGRILNQLDSSIRPYTSKVVAVISPLLIDQDLHVRIEARELICNLTKAAGLANMVATLRPDLDHVDEYVRNITSRVFALVSNTLGLASFLPFLKAVLKSKRWTAKHTGTKIIQQICVNLGAGNGSSLLPYLNQLIPALEPGLTDEMPQIRTITALTISQLAESVRPYGAESFESVLEPIWYGMKKHRGKALASFLKCIGAIIPLLVHNPRYDEYANYYTKEVVKVLSREFNSPDEDMRKTVLRILMSLPISKQIVPAYETEILQPVMKYYWNRRTASDLAQVTRLVVEATAEIAKKLDFVKVVQAVVFFTKDANEKLRLMAVDAINRIVTSCADDLISIDNQTELQLVDGVLYAFQEQTQFERVYLLCLGTLAYALGLRLKPHMNSIISTILFRMKNKLPEVREQSADLIVLLAPSIKKCYEGNEDILQKLILILYESLGEVSPVVLGSIINAMYACINTMDKSTLHVMNNPSINQLLPSLTPILRNKQEKVQEACVRLTGLIAQRNSETINAKEWMRICFELLEMLKSTRKRIRIAANETFGFVAKSIGPQDIIVMLLNNLRVQERQLRVCTAVAIGIVAETCEPFTVLPAIMNEYRIPEKNVQNGVLKATSFLFEYLEGSVASEYLFAVTPLITDALTDRDQVHRQTAATIVRHLALNSVGMTNGRYDEVFVHFLNLLLPNVFETSPHVIERILESIDALRIVLGVGVFTNYIWAGLFHPARKVRALYWRMYNAAYIYSSDQLVPYYPALPAIEANPGAVYDVPELDIII